MESRQRGGMIIVLSPAKALDFSAPAEPLAATWPQFQKETAELAQVTRKLSAGDLKRLMSLSDNLAELNRERFQAFDPSARTGLQALEAQGRAALDEPQPLSRASKRRR